MPLGDIQQGLGTDAIILEYVLAEPSSFDSAARGFDPCGSLVAEAEDASSAAGGVRV